MGKIGREPKGNDQQPRKPTETQGPRADLRGICIKALTLPTGGDNINLKLRPERRHDNFYCRVTELVHLQHVPTQPFGATIAQELHTAIAVNDPLRDRQTKQVAQPVHIPKVKLGTSGIASYQARKGAADESL